MKPASRPMIDLVLIGGGHAHVSVLKSFGMNPVEGVRLTLISDVLKAPYSGMLPGFVEGVWNEDEMHIDLPRLSQFAGARFIHGAVTDVDARSKQIELYNTASVSFDILSINSGGQPDISAIDGADRHAIAVKPISQFISKMPCENSWGDVVSIIGGGAAGIELALGFHQRFQNLSSPPSLQIFSRSSRLLPHAPVSASQMAANALRGAGIEIHLSAPISELTETHIISETGQSYRSDHHFLVTPVKPAEWISRLGARTDEAGFLLTRPTLQLLDHEMIFAAGDVAQIAAEPRPKAGVFAVRAGPVLTDNLRALIARTALRDYRPQRRYLALIGLGGRNALALWGPFALSGQIWWHLKCWIDKRFMDRFNALPDMKAETNPPPALIADIAPEESAESPYFCAGCGAKTGSDVLSAALSEARDEAVRLGADEAYLPDISDLSDSAELAADNNYPQIQSIDTLSQHISDPFIFGRIAALHALSDIFVSGGYPHSALAHLILPRSRDEIQKRDMTMMLAGALTELSHHKTKLVGGHTTAGTDTSLGFAITADKVLTLTEYSGNISESCLILTKRLGIGVILAGHMRGLAEAGSYDEVLNLMLQSNQAAAECLYAHGAIGMTDVTGFGLTGHLSDMLSKTGCAGAELFCDLLPVSEFAVELSRKGIQSSLFPQNKKAVPVSLQAGTSHLNNDNERIDLIYDPQTSGGVLAIVPAAESASCIQALHQAGYRDATIIGHPRQHQTGITLTTTSTGEA